MVHRPCSGKKRVQRKRFAYVREREAARKAKMAVVRSNPHLVKLILNDTELDVVVAARAGSALRLRHKHVRADGTIALRPQAQAVPRGY